MFIETTNIDVGVGVGYALPAPKEDLRWFKLFTGLGLSSRSWFLRILHCSQRAGALPFYWRNDAPVERFEDGIFLQPGFVGTQVLFERDFEI